MHVVACLKIKKYLILENPFPMFSIVQKAYDQTQPGLFSLAFFKGGGGGGGAGERHPGNKVVLFCGLWYL